MEEIFIDDDYNGYYAIMFEDDNGCSILAKTKSGEVAERKLKKFKGYLKEGRLLRPEKSINK